MLHSKNTKNPLKDYYDTPLFGTLETDSEIPKNKLREEPISSSLTYRLIKDELMNEGNSRLNLATFCQTFMEDEATKLMAETLDKNAIDKTEYPQTAEIENRCINMIANLWNVPENNDYIGTSTVGSSEACMLAGLAMKFRWRKRAEKLGLNIHKKPNLVISSGYQVCWEKFCVYWDIELRAVPMEIDNMSLNPKNILDYVDEYTIGVVGILGITYTGKFDNMKELDNVLSEYNESTEHKVYMHIDAASGGLFVPFIDPKLLWDFRLSSVVSINASGHKYGLVYPGIGWVLWKDKKYLPKELIFEVDYLGGHMPTMALNFSRSASPIIGQYYNFLRFGMEGYRQIQQKTRDVANYLATSISKTGLFTIHNNGNELPVVCYELKSTLNKEWTLYDLSDRLQMKGWQVPSYPLPKNLENIVIQRIVCRADLSYDMAELFIRDFKTAINDLDNASILIHGKKTNPKTYGFTH